jgi:hypothetical protein
MSDTLIEGMTRDQIAALFAYDALSQLIRKGLITGPDEITIQGKEAVELLKSRGLEPTPQELLAALHAITNPQ